MSKYNLKDDNAGGMLTGVSLNTNNVSFGHDSMISASMTYPPQPFEVVTSHPKDGSEDKHTVEVKGNMVVEDSQGNKVDVGDTLNEINRRLGILQPNPEVLEKFKALQDLYDQYKMMEKLLMESSNDKRTSNSS